MRFTQAQVDAINARSTKPKMLPAANLVDQVTAKIGTIVSRFVIPGDPVGKPRMTRRDKWAKRPCVLRYRAWADAARASCKVDGLDRVRCVVFVAYFAIPKSWSKTLKQANAGALHSATPDADNVAKGILDSLFQQDSQISIICGAKQWDDGQGPRVEIELWA